MVTFEKVVEVINSSLDLNLEAEHSILESTLKDLGIDSLDTYSILAELESLTGKKVPDEDASKLRTIKNLIDYFN
jgi:acyl carrier protein